jgi:hypothetical protein
LILGGGGKGGKKGHGHHRADLAASGDVHPKLTAFSPQSPGDPLSVDEPHGEVWGPIMETETPMSRSARRRQREKEMRFRSIFDAAETLFENQGYQQTSIEQISDRAELSVGTVYFYFRKKEEILTTLMDDIAFTMRQVLGEAVRYSDGSIEELRNAGEAFFSSFAPATRKKSPSFSANPSARAWRSNGCAKSC